MTDDAFTLALRDLAAYAVLMDEDLIAVLMDVSNDDDCEAEAIIVGHIGHISDSIIEELIEMASTISED